MQSFSLHECLQYLIIFSVLQPIIWKSIAQKALTSGQIKPPAPGKPQSPQV